MSKTRAGGQNQLGGQQIDENVLENLINKVCLKVITKLEDKLDKRFDKIESKFDELNMKLSITDKLVQTNVSDIELIGNTLEELEQCQRKHSLRFDGLKETQNEEVLDIVCDLINNTMKVTCTSNDIDDIYRIGNNAVQRKSKPRTIVVKFVSILKRNEVIRARKMLKNTGIFVNEDLTKKQYNLQVLAKQKVGFRNVWTWGGKVFVKLHDSVKVIRNETDLLP